MKEKLLKEKTRVSSILVSQPQPVDSNSPYYKLADDYQLKIDFRPFIEVEPVSLADFKSQKVKILDHTAVIFSSRHSMDHFFRLCQEGKVEIPNEMKYFCVSEQTANYLQKFIAIRKRKVFCGARTPTDLFDILKKHPGEKFLVPCSETSSSAIPDFLASKGFNYSKAILFRTVASDLSDLKEVNYDVLAFFSPSDVNSLFQNFPSFSQKRTRIAAFGPVTSQAVLDRGLILNIQAPLPEAPSMVGALELYIKEANHL